jgi:hypothetical protein
MIRGQSGQKIGCQMVNATTGAAFTGSVTVYVTGDAGTQAIGSVSSGACTHEGNGYHTYAPSSDETNYALVAFTFIGSGAIPQTIQVETLSSAAQAAAAGAVAASTLTASDLLTSAARRLGFIASVESLGSEDAAEALAILNELIDAWKIERLLISTYTRTTWDITADDGEYTWGSGGDIDAARPSIPSVIKVGFIDTSMDPDHETPLQVMTEAQYFGIPQKALTSPYPQAAYFNPTFGATGLATLTLWPVPTSSDLEGVVSAPTPLDELASVSTPFYAPPGYRRFYISNLMVALAPVFNRRVTLEMREAAEESKRLLKANNKRLFDLSLHGTCFGRANSGGHYDINSDGFVGRIQ